MFIKNQQNFWSGLMFMGIGAFFAIMSLINYQIGTAARMGPGYFPLFLGVLLLILGTIITISGLRGEYSKENDVEKFDWDLLVIFLGSIFLAALMLDHLGLYISIVSLVIFSSLASYEFSFKVSLITAIFMVVFCYFAFVKGLGLIFPLYPIAIGEWSLTAKILIPIGIIIALTILSRKIIKNINKKNLV